MPYRTFNNWLFDGNRTSPIPKPKNGIDILKYNSPITHTHVISLFLNNGVLNHYLDTYFNDINLRYLTREELFKFIKKCVMDFKIRKRDLVFYPRKRRFQLYEKLREKVQTLKNDDLFLLCDIIDKSKEKEAIYTTLGLEKPKKQKAKKSKKIKKGKFSLEDLMENFSTIEIK